MLTLTAKPRKELKKQTRLLRKKGVLPGVLYGPEIKPSPIEVDLKEFKKVYQEAGESSLIEIKGVEKGEVLVLIHETQKDPITEEPLHVDFYKPILTKEVSAQVPLVFKGDSAAIKELGGTLVKNISEIGVKALPQKLPHEIVVDISKIATFEDEILVKDLHLPEGVKAEMSPDYVIVLAMRPEKVEEELEKPIEEKVDEVEKVQKAEKAESEVADKEEVPERTKEGEKTTN